jgi:UDP:flavonoid glycosyltransferase YjiC (YdhE family)
MKVYFGVCGIGLGHAGRCLPIARKLLSRGDDILFSTYNEAYRYIYQEGVPVVEAHPIGFAVKENGEVDFRQTTAFPGAFSLAVFLRQVADEIKYMRGFRPDIVVSDSRASTIVASKLLGIPSLTVLNLYRVKIPREKRFLNLSRVADATILSLLDVLWNMGEEIFIPDFPEPYTVSEGNLGIPPWRRRVHLVGPVLPVRPNELPNENELRERLGLQGRPIIFVPISGQSQEKEYFTSIMLRLLREFPKDYSIVVSLANPCCPTEPQRDGNVTIYNWLPNRFEFLKACDVVISRAGLGTITQSICYGKPMLLIPTLSHTEQQHNAQKAEALGVAKLLDQRKLCLEILLEGIKEVLNSDFSERVEELRRRVVKYDATGAIIDAIDHYAGRKI